MKYITQFRYKANNSEENYPATLLQDELCYGNIFKKYGPVSQLGIQGPPGLRFYLNNSSHPIMFGNTGIYELDLENIGRVVAIRFIKEDIEELLKENKLLIDIVYEGV